MSKLHFNPKFVGADYSEWGFEFTFRTLPHDQDPDPGYNTRHEPYWIINLMNDLGRYVFEGGNWFKIYRFTSTNGPTRMDTGTAIVGIAFAPDPRLPVIKMSNGEVQFLQMVSLTQPGLNWFWQDLITKRYQELVDMIHKDNPLLITDSAHTKSYA